MKIAVDESGDYGLANDRFESYVLCGLIVPDSKEEAVARFMDHARERWRRRELKSSKMRPEWIVHVAEFLASHHISAVAFVTDNEVMTRKGVWGFRLRQAAAIANGRQRIVDANPDDLRIPDIDALMDMVAGVPGVGHMSDDDFIQSHQVPELLLECVQRACQRYRGQEWDADFERFRFVFDAKQPDRLKAGERYIDEHVERMIGSTKRLSLELPGEWKDRPEHPFRCFDDDGGEHMLLGELLGARNWMRSEDDDCVQLADVVAGTVRSVIETGSRSPRWSAYEKLRIVLADLNGQCLRVFRFRGAPDGDVSRYAPLIRAWPQDDRFQRVSSAGAVML
jgi:Protein of unknown function (DUF3800)